MHEGFRARKLLAILGSFPRPDNAGFSEHGRYARGTHLKKDNFNLM
jgi:hypothetical protein